MCIRDRASSGKLDLIVQLPYVIKNQTRRNEAEQRRKDIEFQLKGSQYGIAYTDGAEKITQLNRPAENNLLKTVEYLTDRQVVAVVVENAQRLRCDVHQQAGGHFFSVFGHQFDALGRAAGGLALCLVSPFRLAGLCGTGYRKE